MYTFSANKKKWLLASFVSWGITTVMMTALILTIVYYFPSKRLQENYVFVLIFWSLLSLFNTFYRDHIFKISIDAENQRIFFWSYRIIDGVSDFSLVARENRVTFRRKKNDPDIIKSMLFLQGKKQITWLNAREDGFTQENMQAIADALKKTPITVI